MPSALKKTLSLWLIVFGLFVLNLFTLATPIFAQATDTFYNTPSPGPQPLPLPSSFSNQSPQYANLVVINLIHTFSCLAEGSSIIGQPCIEYRIKTDGPNKGMITPQETLYSSGGALGSVANFMAAIYVTPPLSTAQYLADVRQNMGIAKPAYAQVTGSGNAVLSPILNLWRVSQNIAYLAMIFIFITIGFMLMFRHKLNPQTVIGVQQALPNLVVGLILITFSYFLAALIIDTTFVATYTAGKVFESSQIIGEGTTENLLKGGNIISVFNHFISLTGPKEGIVGSPLDIIDTTQGTLTSLKQGLVGDIITLASMLGGCWVGKELAPDIGWNFIVTIPVTKIAGCAAGAGGGFIFSETSLLGGIVGLILYLVLIIALLIAMFKLLFSLIIAYLSIIVNTIIAPFYFLFGSIPGKQGAISGWFKSMFANLLVFPAVFAALLFAAYILNWSGEPFNIINGPGDFSGGTVPLLGGLSSVFIRLVLAYGILLITPAIPDAIKGAFGVKGLGIEKAGIGNFMAGFGVTQGGYNKWVEPQRQIQKTWEDANTKATAGVGPSVPTRPQRRFPWIY